MKVNNKKATNGDLVRPSKTAVQMPLIAENYDEEKQSSQCDSSLESASSLNTHANSALVEKLQSEIMETKVKAAKATEIAVEAKREVITLKVELKDFRTALEAIQGGQEINETQQPSTLQSSSDVHDGFQTSLLSEDTYTLMMSRRLCSRSWFFGLAIFCVQLGLLGLIFEELGGLSSSTKSLLFNVPLHGKTTLRIAQVLAIFISIMLSSDIIISIKDLSLLWISGNEWTKVVADIDSVDYNSLGHGRRSNFTNRKTYFWMIHIFVPSFFKFMQSFSVLVISLVIVMQSKDVIGLFKDFTTMHFISEFDNIAFYVATHGFFGVILKRDTNECKKIKIIDSTSNHFCRVPIRLIMLLFVLIVMLSTYFSVVVVGQSSGTLMRLKYPTCEVRADEISKIGDGKCNGGVHNSFQCGFDDGDCVDFNVAFPICNALNAFEIGDGTCQEELNTEACGYDAGDCCLVPKDDEYLGDGICHGGVYNTQACAYDHGDCDQFRFENPSCPDSISRPITQADLTPVVLGDGVLCGVPEYMTEACGYEYGRDCNECEVEDASRLGDGVCDGGMYNTESCGFDLGDCVECNKGVDDVSRLGDGVCDGGVFNTAECEWDAGDCRCFNDASAGKCDTDPGYMLAECKSACKAIPLLMNTKDDTFQLQSNLEPSLCLTIRSDDFDGVTISQCSVSNSNQRFFWKKIKDKFSGEILGMSSSKSNACLQMTNTKPQVQSVEIMNSSCTDTWEILRNGALRNTAKGKCMGREANSMTISAVECDSDEAETWYVIDSQYELFHFHLQTMTSGTKGPFKIDGYGLLPEECYNKFGAECDIQLYGRKILTLREKADNNWKFILNGDVGDGDILDDNEYAQNDEYDLLRQYSLNMYDNTECYDVHFKTLEASMGTHNFEIRGHGYVRSVCHLNVGAKCVITICGRRTLVISAYTSDEWKFEISGDVGNLREYKTVPGGTHQPIATMDIEEYDYVQVYDLVLRSSCTYRAMNGDECHTNTEYMQKNCATMCNFKPLYDGSPAQLFSTTSQKCLTYNIGDDGNSNLYYNECDDNIQYQQSFYFRRLESDLFLSFGGFHPFNNADYCVEMYSTDAEKPIVLQSECWNTWEILESGALKNIQENKCMGKHKSDFTKITAVECDSEDVEIWSVATTTIYPSQIPSIQPSEIFTVSHNPSRQSSDSPSSMSS